jgi:1-acyl-sn-glycerol-3-phosphate acyltransferase
MTPRLLLRSALFIGRMLITVAEQGRGAMANGIWRVMVAERTRIARGTQGKYRCGAARLAIAISTPIDVQRREPGEPVTEAEPWIEAEMRRIDPEAYR